MKTRFPQLCRTVPSIHRLQQHDGWGAVFGTLSERLPVGVVTVLADGRIAAMNAAARQILAARDGLCASRSGLTTPRPAERRLLAQRIGLATATALGTSAAGGATLVVPRPSGRRAYVLDIVPVTSPPAVYPQERIAALVLITDPERDLEAVAVRLTHVLGLSNREAQLAAALSAGQSLEAASATLGLTVSTGRAYLKHVFQKTGTHRQSELVALIKRVSPLVPGRNL